MSTHSHTYIAIMAGGVGSRFWPASREARPKQFLDILGLGKSLLRLTFERFRRLVPAEQIFVVTNGQYAGLVQEQLPELTANQVLCEPSRNNTGPCVAYTAFKLLALDPEANLVIAPSDHLILDESAFLEAIEQALAFTSTHEALSTLGVLPTRPDTGYGYIQFERTPVDGQSRLHRVLKFTEKPPLEQAKSFLASGDYLWNAGIFIWRAAAVLEAFRRYAAPIYEILSGGADHYNTDTEQSFIDEAYPGTPNISVDYAIMEHADNIFTIPASFGWSDLGTWASLHAVAPRDEHGNAANSDKLMLYDTQGCLIRLPEGKLLVARDLQDYIIVDEGDVLLLWPRHREQEIKGVTGQVKRGWL